MKTFAVILITLALLLAYKIVSICLSTRKEVEFYTATYEITEVFPPKHFRISFRNVETGQVFNQVDISKHFNDWRDYAWVGRKVKFTSVKEEWHYPKYTYDYFYNGSKEIATDWQWWGIREELEK
jgi:hypothetical protein